LQKSPKTKPAGGRGRGRPKGAGTSAKVAKKASAGTGGTGKRGRPAGNKKKVEAQPTTSASEESSGEQSDAGLKID
jgi:hypothetical protein